MRHWLARPLQIGFCAWFALQGAPVLGQGALKPIQIDPSIAQSESTVHLEVHINSQPTNQTIELNYNPASGKLTTRRNELEEAGVRVPGSGSANDIVVVDQLGYPARYDEARQQLHLTLSDEQRIARNYDLRGTIRAPEATADPGFLLNYSLFGASFQDSNSRLQFSGGNVSFDARAFSKFGVFSQTAIVGSTLYREGTNILRLESTYTFSHQGTAITARAGDFISNGLSWTRPVRMGGVQLQRDFTLRSDIVTRPVPVISGSAAVPSTVDVFINGLKAYTQDVGSGPFRISDLSQMTGSGNARVVVRDATGRETETSMPLTNPIHLLKPGLFDFSIEGGYARRNFGILSDDYDKRPIGSATIRRGISPWLTLEAHAEGGAGLANGGAGASVALGRLGSFTTAASFSRMPGAQGAQIYAGWEGQFNWLSISASSQRTFGSFRDLAAVTAKIEPQQNTVIIPGGLLLPVSASLTSVAPLRALDRLSFSAPLKFDAGSVNVSFIHSQRDDGTRNKLVTLSYNRPMPLKANLFVTGFADFGATRSKGIYAGLNVPILSEVYVTSGVSFDPHNGTAGSLEITKPQPMQDNTYGWRFRDVEGRTSYRLAQGSYRTPYGQVGGQIQQFGDRLDGNMTYDGSIAIMGGGVFPGNKVVNSFAVVDAGKPGVPVLQDNREIGRTNMFGKKLVTELRPYEANNIAIDPSAMPANYDVATTHAKVAPVAKAGVVVNFARQVSQASALVILYGADGKFLKAGAKGKVAGTNEEFVVGYEGQAYIRNLGATNAATIETGTGTCRASFPFAANGNQQVVIDKVQCR